MGGGRGEGGRGPVGEEAAEEPLAEKRLSNKKNYECKSIILIFQRHEFAHILGF